MSIDNAYAPCVLCDAQVLTDDTDNATALTRRAWAHRTCAEKERAYDPCDYCKGKGWTYPASAKCDDDAEECAACNGTGINIAARQYA